MTNVELYINETLCDIRDPQNLGIRLNRVLINPAELTIKDAQYSYSITIPTSPVNDAIFKYINVEETKNKFNHYHTAQVYVDSVLVFDGRFKLSEIDSEGNYKGNLVVPTPKTVKEIFGDKKMSEIAEWKYYLTKDGTEQGEPMGMVEMLNTLNAKEGIPDAIFPLVLYGLLPKVAKDAEGNYSEKDVWDDTVRLGVEDFPASINCMQAIKHIFESSEYEKDKNYEITGSAFNDPKLTNLYMSYSNPTDYEQPWNWAHLGKMTLKGSWYNAIDMDVDLQGTKGGLKKLETKMIKAEIKQYNNKREEDGTKKFIITDLFSAKNTRVDVLEDNGYNIYQYNTFENNEKIQNTNIQIPVSGMYKIQLKAQIELLGTYRTRYFNESNAISYNSYAYTKNGVAFVYSNENGNQQKIEGKNVARNLFHSLRAEIKLVRTRDGDELDLTEQGIDGLFFRGNFKQLDEDTNLKDKEGRKKFSTYPKYFPQENSVLWVDPYQNRNFICGLHWGKRDHPNPIDLRERPCYKMAAKSGISWNTDNDDVNYCVANSASYLSYKPIAVNVDETYENTIQNGEDYLGYIDEGVLKMTLDNTTDRDDYISRELSHGNLNEKGEGAISVIMWLNKGDSLKLLDVTDIATWNNQYSTDACVAHNTTFSLTIEPYKKSTDWASVKMDGTGKAPMSWADNSDYAKNYIDLAKFLPSEQKIDDWIDNFCKAFNLDLLQPEAGKFQLNTKKRSDITAAPSVLDLSDKVDVRNRINQPLGLPSEISASFKIDKDEEGYDWQIRLDEKGYPQSTTPDEGNGILHTGSLDGKPILQSTNFSYCWYKDIDCKYFFGNISGYRYDVPLPIISKKEVWEQPIERADYVEMQQKTYTSLPQRFWYRSKEVYNMGALWKNRYEDSSDNFSDKNKDFYIYPVVGDSRAVTGSEYLTLDYKDKPNSILRTYFTLISTDDSNYTEVECFLMPYEYDQLASGKLVSLNSDLYYVASVDGYDPVGRNKTKLKLIRKV